MSATGFRQDINGLRALAVLGVVAFHFKLGPPRAGGFAGVDVFFVISGFLMTQIITGRLDRGAFSLAAFLQARVRRIVPAFVTMVIGVLLAGFLLLNPLVFEGLAHRAAWTLPFLSNWLFATQDTYFHAPDQNWLLHTWSLSVEAQFYLIFPLLLMALRKIGGRGPVEPIALCALTIGSFSVMLWCLSAGGSSRDWSFFMLWSRVWEFLAGGLCAYALPRLRLGAAARTALHYGGLTAIVVTMLVVHYPTPWPSFATALPVAGAAAILLAGHADAGWARFAPTARLGLWSYSLYLWHWPLAAALSFFGCWSIAWRLVGVAASLLLAAASYEWIEHRVTDYLWRVRGRPWKVGAPAAAAALCLATSVAVATPQIEALRYAFHPSLVAQLKEFREAQNDELLELCDETASPSTHVVECRLGKARTHDTLVVGDSFAWQLIARYKNGLPSGSPGVVFVVQAGCSSFSRTTRINFAFPCEKWQDELYRYILRSDFKRVAFVSAWPHYKQGSLCLLTEQNCGLDLSPAAYDMALDAAYRRLADLWKALREQGKAVTVFEAAPYPGEPGDPLRLYERVATGQRLDDMDFSYKEFVSSQAATTRRLRWAVSYAGAVLADPAVSMCPDGRCPVVRGGHPLYLDAYHLRASMMKEHRFSSFDRYIIPGQTVRVSGNDATGSVSASRSDRPR